MIFERLRSIPDALSALLDIAKALKDYNHDGLNGRLEIDEHTEVIFTIRRKYAKEQSCLKNQTQTKTSPKP